MHVHHPHPSLLLPTLVRKGYMFRYIRLTDRRPVHLDGFLEIDDAEQRFEKLFRGDVRP